MASRKWALVFAALWLGVACQDTSRLKGHPEDREGDSVADQHPPPPPPGEPLPVGEPCPPRCAGPAPVRLVRASRENPIAVENARPGHANWREGRPANAGQLELYTGVDSAQAGETVAVKVSVDADAPITAEVYRLGYYGGAGARKVWSGGPFQARRQAACPTDPATGLVECGWTDTFSFTVGPDWVSGLYLVKVRRPDGFKRFAPLVVRDDRAAELLFQPAFNTYQAYNFWGGQSLYATTSATLPHGRAYLVSYDRPYRDDEGSGQVLRWEYPFIRFLEQQGYDVTYASNLDFERFDGLLDGIGAFVHGGHDEYWTTREREQVDAALASGRMSLAHFGGNSAYWRVRMLSNAGGQRLRTLVCFKNASELDPQVGSTVRFRDPPDAHPENELFGAMYDGWQVIPFPLIVGDPGHWLFAGLEGTGLRRGSQLHGLLGYEFDRVWDDGHTPPGTRVVMESPVVTAEGVPSRSHVVERTLPSGRLVFSAGTIYWPLALSEDPELYDARVARMTLNVLERALSHRRAPRALPVPTGPFPTQPEPKAAWAARVEALAGQAGPGGYRDGPGQQALFQGPTGLAVLPGGQVVVADTGNNRIRLIDVDPVRTVRTLAGNGELGLRDGAGEQAMFRRPTSVALGPDGALYVADSDNHNIRRLEQTATGTWQVSTWAGGARQQGYRDGPAETARFRRPTAIAFDALGNLYVADQAGNRVRMVQAGSREVVTVAGTGQAGFADAAVGLQAAFNNPSALAVGPGGELYVLDANQRVRRISAGGARAVVSVAGHPERPLGFADGTGAEARFRAQMGMVVNAEGEVLVADTANYRIRKVIPGADAARTSVWTIAGSGLLGTRLGTGDVADIVAPAGLALSADGSILVVSDSGNNVIRAVVR